ncbi:acetyltransferase [Cohnella kolymensis]|uniref:Acetyltransferase n=1 Tax=Cohnella kolymensis TaxID=1590652 RepID=A0ABR5A3Q8_9BACL|nr:GNAT family protein [Cohnella kolymensis]KIL35687.1 acetyltransferase [Cohnella kolymensis]
MSYLFGERIVLRDYRYEDLPHMRQWVNDYDITNTLHDVFLYPQTVHDTESFLRMKIEGELGTGFVIAAVDTFEYIGQIDLAQLDWKNRSANLGLVIGRKEFFGRGIGSEAIELMKGYVFNTLNLHRLALEVYEYNERGYRCYLKCGFREEGRLRQKIFREGRYWDSVLMSILRDEYIDAN